MIALLFPELLNWDKDSDPELLNWGDDSDRAIAVWWYVATNLQSQIQKKHDQSRLWLRNQPQNTSDYQTQTTLRFEDFRSENKETMIFLNILINNDCNNGRIWSSLLEPYG